MNPLWSYVLTGIGVTGLYAVTNKKWWGFAIGLFVQLLWVAYAVTTRQHGFIGSACVYGYVNYLGWKRFRRADKEHVGVAETRAA